MQIILSYICLFLISTDAPVLFALMKYSCGSMYNVVCMKYNWLPVQYLLIGPVNNDS